MLIFWHLKFIYVKYNKNPTVELFERSNLVADISRVGFVAAYCTVALYCTVLYCTVALYCTVLYCTVLYSCTVLYCTVQLHSLDDCPDCQLSDSLLCPENCTLATCLAHFQCVRKAVDTFDLHVCMGRGPN